jgi:branched-chain amino acid transport system substrate-binding protein
MCQKLVFLILTSALLVLCARTQAQAPRVKIGLITPLSGSRASIGEDAGQGADLAMEDLKSRGEFANGVLEIVFEDSQGDPAKGVNAYKKLVMEGVKFIITQNSNVSLPIAPLANADGVIQLAITTTSDRYSTPNDFTFRTNGPTVPEALVMADFLDSRLKVEPGPLALITMQDEYPVTLRSHLLPELAKRKIELALNEDFLPSDTDFRTLITRAKAKGVKYIVIIGYQTQVGFFVKQQKELGLGAGSILTNTPVNNREFFTAAGEAAEGVMLTYPGPDYEHPAAKEFKEKYGKEANVFSANAYDAVIIAQLAFSRCNFVFAADCLKKALYSIKDFKGLSGNKSFDDVNGDMQDTYVLMIAKDGKFVPVK